MPSVVMAASNVLHVHSFCKDTSTSSIINFLSSSSPTSPCHPLSARYFMNFASSSARSTPVMSGTNKYVTMIPVMPQMAAIMKVHLRCHHHQSNSKQASTEDYIGNTKHALLAEMELNRRECLGTDRRTRLTYRSRNAVERTSNAI